tara:strand:+ start:720 stop:893 length:174 start_codon:yes stop_codon:yes gene_type:complete
MVQDTKNERTYQLYQVYKDKAAADAHMESEHLKAIFKLRDAGKFKILSMDRGEAFDI